MSGQCNIATNTIWSSYLLGSGIGLRAEDLMVASSSDSYRKSSTVYQNQKEMECNVGQSENWLP